MGSYRRSTLRMARLLLAASLVAGALGKTCDTLPNRKTNSTLDAKDRISSFFSPKHCLAVDAEMDSADLHGQGNHDRANAKVYWADCSAVADDSKTAFAMTNKDGKTVQVVAAEFEHTTVKKGKMTRTGFTMIKLKDDYKKDRCIQVSGFSDISSGNRLQLSRCDKKDAKMRFTGNGAGMWVYKNKKRSKWCLWPPKKTGDTAKVGLCINGLLGGAKA